MAQSVLPVKVRTNLGKNAVKKIRNEGNIPAILYGKHISPIPLIINPNELKTALNTDSRINTLLELKIDGMENQGNNLSVIKTYQMDPVSRKTIHIDLHSIKLNKRIKVTVPIEIIGRAKGVTEGGSLEQHLREIELSCMPTNIPNSIKLDITDLSIGESIQVKSLKLGEEIEVMRNEDETILGVVSAKGEDLTEDEEGSIDELSSQPEESTSKE